MQQQTADSVWKEQFGILGHNLFGEEKNFSDCSFKEH